MQEIPSVISDDVESESSEPDVPEEKMENDSPELSQTTYKQASLPSRVEKEVRGAPESESTAPVIPEEKTENHSPQLLQTISKPAFLPTGVQKEVRHENSSPKSILRGSSEVSSDMPASGTPYSHAPVSAGFL